jgi:aminomethyltransferase
MGIFTYRYQCIGFNSKVTSNDASLLTVEKHNILVYQNDGGIVDDLIIYKMKEEQYLLVVNASNIDKDWDWISAQNDLGVEMKTFRMITPY